MASPTEKTKRISLRNRMEDYVPWVPVPLMEQSRWDGHTVTLAWLLQLFVWTHWSDNAVYRRDNRQSLDAAWPRQRPN